MDIRAARLVDLPLIARLIERTTLLDSELAYTREANIPQNLLLERFPLSGRELYTLIGRDARQPIIGQFRLRGETPIARAVYLAPSLDEASEGGDTAYLHLLDGMTAEAGRRGAHALTAEVDEFSRLFVTMRTAGFAVYARQQIWVRTPDKTTPAHIVPAALMEARDEDSLDIQSLYCNIVPKLVQPVGAPPMDTGYVYGQPDQRQINGQKARVGKARIGLQGYIAVSEGKSGIYMMPLLHPDILFEEASSILAGAIARVRHADRLPLYICVRRYQDWLEETLIDLGFEPGKQQAVMVRHIAVGVRQAMFAAPVRHALEAGMPAPIIPPTSRLHELESNRITDRREV